MPAEEPVGETATQEAVRPEQASRPRPAPPEMPSERQRGAELATGPAAADGPVTAAVAPAESGASGGQSSQSQQHQVAGDRDRAVAATDGTNAPAFSLAEATRASAPAQPAANDRELAVRDLSELNTQLATRAKLVRTPGRDEFTVRLELPEVGQVSVRIVRDAGGVAVNLQTSSDSLRRALQSQMPNLESALRENGVQMSSFSAGDRGDQRDDAYQAWFGGQQAGSGQHRRGEALYNPGPAAGVAASAAEAAVDSAAQTAGPAAQGDTGSDRGFSRWA